MDGVIVDTEPVHRFAYYQQFKELKIVVTEEMYTSFTGNSTRNTFQKLKKLFPNGNERGNPRSYAYGMTAKHLKTSLVSSVF